MKNEIRETTKYIAKEWEELCKITNSIQMRIDELAEDWDNNEREIEELTKVLDMVDDACGWIENGIGVLEEI